VNLLLVDPEELGSDATCTLTDRRAQHLRSVLGAVVGSRVRAGVIRGGLAIAEVIADDGTAITLRLGALEAAPRPAPIELVLAIPRPKVLTRVVEIAAAFGVSRIDLTNAWRVDKSYLSSPRLEPSALAHAARLGAEQGATTQLPAIHVHRRLMALIDRRSVASAPEEPVQLLDPVQRVPDPSHALDDRWPGSPVIKLIAHLGAPPIEAAVAGPPAPMVLAIGPEGGWIDREVETFTDHGFSPVSLGTPILRVEAAVAAALGQLLLLRRLAER
jgi:16S rRNA (uracil1498-N3)-methyltransferase